VQVLMLMGAGVDADGVRVSMLMGAG